MFKRLRADGRFAGCSRLRVVRVDGGVSLYGSGGVRLPMRCYVWPGYCVVGGEVCVSSILLGVDDSGLSDLQREGLERAVWDVRTRRLSGGLYVVGAEVVFV